MGTSINGGGGGGWGGKDIKKETFHPPCKKDGKKKKKRSRITRACFTYWNIAWRKNKGERRIIEPFTWCGYLWHNTEANYTLSHQAFRSLEVIAVESSYHFFCFTLVRRRVCPCDERRMRVKICSFLLFACSSSFSLLLVSFVVSSSFERERERERERRIFLLPFSWWVLPLD